MLVRKAGGSIIPTPLFVVFTYMLILGGGLRRSFLISGVALSTSSTAARHLSSSGKTSVALDKLSVFLTATSSDDSETIGPDDSKNRDAATGWNHNLPSDSSRFWRSPNGSSASNSSSTSDDQSNTPRTGWLHNTKPKRTAQEPKVGGISKAQQRLKQAMKQQEENHRIIHPPAFHACGNDRQIVVTEHRISVPVFRSEGKKEPRIDVAFSIVEEVKDEAGRSFYDSLQTMTPSQRAVTYVEKAALKSADEMMIYLQGGPGFGSPTPVTGLSFSQGSSWGSAALGKYKRIVLMDQRGTGQSTPITKQSLEQRFPDLFVLDDREQNGDLNQLVASHPEEYNRFQAALGKATDYMAQFRADNIVKDAEMIREALLQPLEEAGSPPTPRPWGCSLGQSFGGFCTMTYLSQVDNPPRICLFTGGIAPMTFAATEVYSKLWARVKERSLRYYEVYPGDIAQVKKIVKKLLERPAELPSGGRLTARRFLQLGMNLGGSPSSFASMHSLVSTAFLQPGETEFTRAFLKSFDTAQPFDDHPIYFWLHESIYCDGPKFSPSSWSAERVFQETTETPSELDYKLTSHLPSDKRPTIFLGEMVFPWMSEDYAECSGIGCTALANALATKEDWPALYDGDHMRAVLANGTTKSAAAVYYDDIYVDFDCCMKLTARGG
jgi:hypothetical protein